MVGLEEPEETPLATSLTQFVDRAVNLIVTARLEALTAPPGCSRPKTIFRPMVGGIASPAVAIFLWAVEGEVVV